MPRTFARIYIYSCPDGQRDAVLKILDDRNFELESDAEPDGDLCLDERYVNSEAPEGCCQDVAQLLAKDAPGVSFKMWEDPDSAMLGQVFMYTPALGGFTADCDSAGEVVFNFDLVRTALRSSRRSSQILAELGMAMGQPWALDYWTSSQTAGSDE